jgi:hypothetical protein
MSTQAMRCIAAAAFAFALTGARAAATPDPNALWYDARENGWGLSVAQQGDKVYATLFVYDPAGIPEWFVASEMRAELGSTGLPAHRPIVSGALFSTTGPSLGLPFDPHPVAAKSAGTLSLSHADSTGQSLEVGYLVDGATITQTVARPASGDAGALLAGRYAGGVVITTAPAAGCPRLDVAGANDMPLVIDVAAGSPSGMSQLTWATGADSVCTIAGRYAQGAIQGMLGCGALGHALSNDTTAEVAEIAPGPHGFAAMVRFRRAACTYAGHIGGVRLP